MAATGDPSLLAALRGELHEPLFCPACRREFEESYRHCPYDSSPLFPLSRAQELPSGMVCPQCSRGFEPGVRHCSHDAEELIPYSLYCTTHPPNLEADEDFLRKICPLCTHKYQGAASFCGRDGAELVSMN
jgi:predicted amidophosphoribosyltransferase